MDDTPRGNRLHIAIFGRRNVGKSSLINFLTNQQVALVSNVPGTTTDPVYKAMEILPIGPVVIIDTAGIDDQGYLGEMRVEKALKVLSKTDLVISVFDSQQSLMDDELNIINLCREKNIPIVGVLNKVDLFENEHQSWEQEALLREKEIGIPFVGVSTLKGWGLEQLKSKIIEYAPNDWAEPTILGDLINPGDLVVLVVPIDLSAPKGRLILPQVQTIRDLLDYDASTVVVKESGLKELLDSLGKKPALVVTDSQVFGKVNQDTPEDLLLTSFSILFARYKGNLRELVQGALAIEKLKPGDKVLIAEACTHHRTDDDIGKVKIPRWLNEKTGGNLEFEWASGSTLPEHLNEFKLIVHCGGCMINRREMLSRIMQAGEAGVPIVNYGVSIAYLHGILKRVLSPFPGLASLLDK